MTRARTIGLAVSIIVMALPFLVDEYHLTVLTYVGLSAIVALGLVVLTGQAGLPSFGQAAYVGLGAYLTAILTLRYGASPWLTLPLVLVTAAAGSYFGALITVRLSGHFFPLATIAFAVSAYFLFGALAITGGQTGLANIPRLSIAGVELKQAWQFYAIVAVVLLAIMQALNNLLDSRMGRAIRALSGSNAMVEAMGIDTRALKVWVFVLACVLAALAGWLYAHFQQFVNPTPFSLNQGIEYLFMAVVGGAASLWGALIGAGLVILLKQWLQAVLPGIVGHGGNFEIVVFGVLIILLFQFAPEGLTPRLARLVGLAKIEPRRLAKADALPRRPRAAPGAPLLTIRNAGKAFGGILANKDVSLDLHAGEVLAVIGPNGAGKSTLFNLVTGVMPADSGSFAFCGTSIAGAPAREIARLGINRTFQHVRLLPAMSAIENVALGAHQRGTKGMLSAMLRLDRAEEAQIFAEAERQLASVGLADLAWVTAGTLPLGQQRVLEIARALAADPQVLLLDEPAAGLRHKEKEALASLIAALRAEGMGILLVEHDMDFVMGLADRILVLDYGQRLAEGSPGEIRSDPRVLDAYLGGGE
jgi:ABC-type branched-subunit amino acid transport system ATPase component/ABC-type branched-subunit amino acid transport system permease subunit